MATPTIDYDALAAKARQSKMDFDALADQARKSSVPLTAAQTLAKAENYEPQSSPTRAALKELTPDMKTVTDFGGDLLGAAKGLGHMLLDPPKGLTDIPVRRAVEAYYRSVQESNEAARKAAEQGHTTESMIESAATGLPVVGSLVHGVYGKSAGVGASRIAQAASMAPEGSVIPNPAAAVAARVPVAVRDAATAMKDAAPEVARRAGDFIERNAKPIANTGAGAATAATVIAKPILLPAAAAEFNTTRAALLRGAKSLGQTLQRAGGRVSLKEATAEAAAMRQPIPGQLNAAEAEAVPKGQRNAVEFEANRKPAEIKAEKPQFVSDADIHAYVMQEGAGLKIQPIDMTTEAKSAVNKTVDEVLPGAKNLRVKSQVAFELRRGNLAGAAEAIVKEINPKTRAELLDDQAWQQEMNWDLGKHALAAQRERIAMEAPKATPKWELVATAKAQAAFDQVMKDAQTKNSNPLRGLRNTEKKSATPKPQPEDLTSLLEQSIAAALAKKKSK